MERKSWQQLLSEGSVNGFLESFWLHPSWLTNSKALHMYWMVVIWNIFARIWKTVNNVFTICKQYVKDIILGDPKGSIFRLMLFDAFLIDFFFWIIKPSVHNFADDNTLSSFAKSVMLLVEVLTAESRNAIKWFSENKILLTQKILNQFLFKKVIKQANLNSF